MLLLLFSVLLAHLVLLLNTRFTLWPEMVVYPYLVNNGFELYKDIINPYMPSFIYILSLFEKVFGTRLIFWQIFTWIVVIVTDLLIFKIAKIISGKNLPALLATVFFVIFSIPFGANNLWFDLAQTPFIILSVFFFWQFLQKPESKNSLFYSTLFLTLAFFIKQQAIWLAIFFSIFFVVHFKSKSKDVFLKNLKILLPAAIIFMLHLFLFVKKGTLADFLFWTIYFPFVKASTLPGYLLLPSFRQTLPIVSILLVFLPLYLARKNSLKFFAQATVPLLFFAYPRFDYFHLIPALATLSIAFPQNIALARKSKILMAALIAGLFLSAMLTTRYILKNTTSEIRFFEHQIYETATLVQKITQESEPIYIQNGPDQILPLSGRLPTKPWADEFPWYLETGQNQNQVLAGIKTQNPRYLVFKPYEQGPEFLVGSYRPKIIADYLDAAYQNWLQINDFYWLKIKI